MNIYTNTLKLDFITRSHLEHIAQDWENEAEQTEIEGDVVWYNIAIDEAVKANESLNR